MKSFWWLQLPQWAGRLSQWLALALTDGYFLLTLSTRFANWLSPSILAFGLACGGFRWGYKITPIEAPVLFYAFLFLGMLSGHVGILLLLGFALGDFITTKEIFTAGTALLQIKLILAKLHEYILFGIGIIYLPLLGKQLVALVVQSLLSKVGKYLNTSFGRWVLFGFVALLNMLIIGYLTFLWAQSVPLLIRALYLHIGRLTKSNISFFQVKWDLLVLVAIAATLLRLVGQGISLSIQSVKDQAEEYETKIRLFVYIPGLLEQAPSWMNALWNAVFLTFLFWGAFLNQIDPVLFFISVIILYIFRSYIGQLKIWPNWVLKIWQLPTIWRLLFAALVVYGLVQKLLPFLIKNDNQTFWPVLIPTLLSLFLLSLLLPYDSRKPIHRL